MAGSTVGAYGGSPDMEAGPGQMNTLFSNAASYYIIHHHRYSKGKQGPFLPAPPFKDSFYYFELCACVCLCRGTCTGVQVSVEAKGAGYP